MTDRLTAEQWSRYWRHGTLTTFRGRFADNYEGRIRDHWHRVLEGVPVGGKVVDLATGNGAIALIAAQYGHRRQRDLEVVGVDSAEIQPAENFAGKAYARHLRRIRFLGGTPITATTLPDASFDLATSQFGIEYAEPEPAVSELQRLLKPSGSTFAALVHHSDSALLRQAREGLEQVLLCEKSGLQPAVRDLHRRLDQLESRGKDPSDDHKAKQLRAKINECLESLRTAGARYADPGQLVFYVENSMATFNPEVTKDMNVEQKLAALRDVAAETTAYRQRMRDMISSALDDDQLKTLAERLQRCGFRISENQPFVFEGTHFCHALTATR